MHKKIFIEKIFINHNFWWTCQKKIMNISETENQSFTSNVMALTRLCIWRKHTIMVPQVNKQSFPLFTAIASRNLNYFLDGPGHYSEYLQSIGENPCICIPGFHRHPDGRCIWFHDNNYCQTVHHEQPQCNEGTSLR